MKQSKGVIGILVFTNEETLNHKTTPNLNCYWEMGRLPQQFNESNYYKEWRIYFAVKGIVLGYFKIDMVDDGKIEFDSNDWHPIEKGEKKKGHQGFEYYIHGDKGEK